jgi:hypothetical protein
MLGSKIINAFNGLTMSLFFGLFLIGADTIVVMTKDFDVITELPIHVDEEGEGT